MPYLGIEIGGTKLQAAIGDGQGAIESIERLPAHARGGHEAICRQILELVETIIPASGLDKSAIEHVGIGFGGPVDPANGRILTSHQVDGWDNFPFVEWFTQETGLPAVLGNDSDLAGLAEAHFGAGRGASRVVYMNIGSGIGGAIVIDGRLYTSHGAGASEIGHLRIRPAHPGGPWRTLEQLASGWNMSIAARREAERNPESLLSTLVDGHLSRISTETLVKALESRDPEAVDVWLKAIESIGVAVANVITLLRPDVFVVGGGVSLAGPLLFNPLKREVEKQCFAPFIGSYELVPAELGEAVVLHGALKLALDRGH